MKTTTRKPAPSKLLAMFDMQLLQIITEDLKAYRANNPAIRKVGDQQQLIAA